VTLVWTPEQRAAIATIVQHRRCLACDVGLPAYTYTPIFAPRKIAQIAQEATTRARVRRRQRLAHQIAIAIGWLAS